MSLSKDDRKEIADVMSEVLDERRQNDDTHRKQHVFVGILIDERESRKRRWEKIKTQIAGWGIISALSFLAWLGLKAYELWDAVKHSPHS